MICWHNWHTMWSRVTTKEVASRICFQKLLLTWIVTTLFSSVGWYLLYLFQNSLHAVLFVTVLGGLTCSSFICAIIFPAMLIDALDSNSPSKRLLPFYDDTVYDVVCLKCHKVDFGIQRYLDKEIKLQTKEANKTQKQRLNIEKAEESYRKQKSIMLHMLNLK